MANREMPQDSSGTSGSIRSYRDLDVWRVSVELAELCYRVTAGFPDAERFGLTAQMRRASVSVPSNIAEGHGRESRQDFVRFLRIAQGSIKELETQAIVAHRVGLVDADQCEAVLLESDRIGRMLRALIRSLQGDNRE